MAAWRRRWPRWRCSRWRPRWRSTTRSAARLYVAFAPASRCARRPVFAALWTLAELLRGSWFTGFPWGAGGYAHVDGPLAVLCALGRRLRHRRGRGRASRRCWRMAVRRLRAGAPWLAPVGLALVLFGVPALIALARGVPADDAAPLARPHRRRTAAGQHPAGREVRSRRRHRDRAAAGTASSCAMPTAPLVITPETALPLLPSQLPPGYLEAIAARYASGSAGRHRRPADGRRRAATATRCSASARARRRPIATTSTTWCLSASSCPGLFRWFTDMMNIPLGDFRSGGLAQPPFVWQGQRIAPNICYEDLVRRRDRRQLPRRGHARRRCCSTSATSRGSATRSRSTSTWPSRACARWSSQRPMVRATNTGATVVIDHRGRVTHSLPRLTRGVLMAEVEGRTRPHAVRALGVALRAVAAVGLGRWPSVAAAIVRAPAARPKRPSTGQSRSLPGLSRPQRVEALLHLDDLRRQRAAGLAVLDDEDVRVVDAHAVLAVQADDLVAAAPRS